MTAIDGTLEHAPDGTPMLRFERRYRHPVERVWRAITDPDELRAWFPQRVEFAPDLRLGAKVRFTDDPNMPGESFDGEVLALDPPRVLELRWGTDRLRMELRTDGDGTVLVFTDTFSEEDKAARDATGWHVCLDALGPLLDDGEPPEGDPMERWSRLNPLYEAKFASG
jgi:uncharacterized protein YndB with AHSA1/START domain